MSFTAVPIQEFLTRRRESVEAAKEAAKTNPNMIVVDPDDEIICDLCNELVVDDAVIDGVVWIKRDSVYCSTCRRKNG